ncbi:protein PRR14L isoform X1 [Eleutherodactylus coqui]|uniref:protein PRR14L isoform X1 n=1 Tax=Eleutherodactylus coqui TaxID=57060 RepID=UPI003462FD11
MLEPGVVEHRPLNPLSVVRTVTHWWPELQVPFINELYIGPGPIPDPGDLDQVALQVNVPETRYALTEVTVNTKIIPELVSCPRKEDASKLFIVNSSVMLDAVEKVTTMEICHSAQNMMLQESVESSDLQISDDCLEITIARDLTNQLHMKDGHALSDPESKISDEAAGMEVMGTRAVLHSEHRERVGNLPNEPNRDESIGLERSDSVKVLTETGSLAAAKTRTSTDEFLEGFPRDECTLPMSMSHQCTVYNTKYEESVKCLEADHLPPLQCTSNQRTFDPADFPKVPTSLHATYICKEPGLSCINEVRSSTCLLEGMEPNTADINAPKENVPRGENLDRSVESIEQEMETTSSDDKHNNILVAYHSQTESAKTASIGLQDVQSDTSKVDLYVGTSPGNLEDDLSFKPNLPSCFENLTCAKAFDTEDCSSSSLSDRNTPLSDDTPDCHKNPCAIKVEDISDQSSHSVLCSAPNGEASYAISTSTSSLGDQSETSYMNFSPHTRASQLDGEGKGPLSMSVAPSNDLDRSVRNTEPNLSSDSLSRKAEENRRTVPQTIKLHPSEEMEKVVTQSEGFCNMVPAVINDPTTSLEIVEDSHRLLDAEDSSGSSDLNAVIHDVSNCEEATTSHMQSDLLSTIKETVLTSDYLKVPCRTVGYCISETPSYALVPYIDIWCSVSKPEGNSQLSLKEPKNVIRKEVESQELKKDEDEYKGSIKEGCLLQEPLESSLKDTTLKAFMNPQEIVDLSHCGGKCKDGSFIDSFRKKKTLLAQDVASNLSTECNSLKMPSNRISIVPSTVNQSEGVRHFNSSASRGSSVGLDAHKMFVLPQLVDVRRAGNRLNRRQSEQTNVCLLKEKCTPHLSLSNHHLGDGSALLFPSSLPGSPIAMTRSKNREKSHNNLLGSLQLHVTNLTDSPVQIERKSLSVKSDAELGPRHISTLEEPSKPPDSVQISSAEVNGPKQSVQPTILNNSSPLMLHMEKCSTHERMPSPVKAVVKTKATQVKSRRNVLNAEIKIHETSHKDCQLLKGRTRQSASCTAPYLHMTTGNRKTYNLRSAPQSLKCSILQEAKRPKIFNENICSATSGLLNCVNTFSQKSKSHNFSQAGLARNRKELPSAIQNPSCLSTDISAKRPLDRRCKNFSTQGTLLKKMETRACRSSPILKIHNSHGINVECKSSPSKHVDLNMTSKPHYSKMTRDPAGFPKLRRLQKCTQDQMLLTKLSAIANRLTAPSKSETFSSKLKVVPFNGVKFQAKKLLTLFSCVNRRMNSRPGQIWQENMCLTSSRNRLVSKSTSLYPTSFPKTGFSQGDNVCLNAFDNLTFPVSFHVNVDPSCLSDFLKLNPPDYILRSPQPTTHSPELSEWTLSLFLSSDVPADTNNVHPLTQWNPHFRSLESSSEASHTTKLVRKSGCSIFGLHTVLALSSPGCYRLWTRRNLGSRTSSVQRLSVMQFAHGLKGSAAQFLRPKDQFSSLAFSLGRILSTWSQHVSAFSSDCAITHPNCSVWLPSQSNSNIRSPKSLVSLPPTPFNNIPQLNTYSLPAKKCNLALKPRTCHMGLPFYLCTQQKDDPRPPCWLSTENKSNVEVSSCSIKQENGPKFSFVFSTLKEDNLNLLLDPLTQQKNHLERPLSLSSLKHDLKPELNISLQKDQKCTVDPQCDVSFQEDTAVDLPCPASPPKGHAYPFEHRENIIPCTQSQKEYQVNEKGLSEGKPQRVSQIRIRKTIPKPDPNLTPMGLPKPKRENKKEFSLEDIYTNKNYKSPPPARSLETIFEEPKEKNGVLISVSQQKRKRILEFRDCTVPRLKRPKGKVKVMTSCKRGRKAAMEGVQLDALLIQKLMDLENCLLEEEAMERGSAASDMAS